MASWNVGLKNGTWKGGRVVASSGYILVRVGRSHHLSDVRGYAYEHRIVAEKILGRKLRAGEEVHHCNGNKADNRPENIEVHSSRRLHAVRHRQRTDLQKPSEHNPLIECACGCGRVLCRFDGNGRPREHITGHNVVARESDTGRWVRRGT